MSVSYIDKLIDLVHPFIIASVSTQRGNQEYTQSSSQENLGYGLKKDKQPLNKTGMEIPKNE